jgi:hypothetical protein
MRLVLPWCSALAIALSGCASTPPANPPPEAPDQRPSQYQPRRVAPSAMEAWIAPWEDATGDLYPPSTVYIQVDPERWQYGGSPGGRLSVLRPLQVEQRSTPEATEGGTVLPPNPASLDAETVPFFAPQSAKRGA